MQMRQGSNMWSALAAAVKPKLEQEPSPACHLGLVIYSLSMNSGSGHFLKFQYKWINETLETYAYLISGIIQNCEWTALIISELL